MKKWFKLLYPLLIFPLLALPTQVVTEHHIASYQMNPEERADMEKAAAIGVVSGTNAAGTLFSPSGQLTREQAAVMLS